MSSPFLAPLGHRPQSVQWGLLLLLSTAFVAVLQALHLPAALLLGPMFAGILLVSRGANIRIGRGPFGLAQAAVGCLIARTITPSILYEMTHQWLLFLVVIGGMLVASSALGWFLVRARILPGTTAVWGTSPGAAAAMVLMSEAYGADMRLVAFMQYFRVVAVVLVATVVARVWTSATGVPVADVVWFAPVDWPWFGATVAIAFAAALIAMALRIPAGPLLLPMVVATVLSNTGVLHIELPSWYLALSYALVGWAIGLRFTREILLHAARAFPQVMLSTVLLITACAGFGVILTYTSDLDPLTAYLATSPGGLDTVAIISASTASINAPFVMALQVARLIVVLLTGPGLSRLVAKAAGAGDKDDDSTTMPID